jgi:hypothetical protein
MFFIFHFLMQPNDPAMRSAGFEKWNFQSVRMVAKAASLCFNFIHIKRQSGALAE